MSKVCRVVRGHCEARPAAADLDFICNPCLDKVILLSRSIGQDSDHFTDFKRLNCAKRNNSYCYPRLMAQIDADDRFLAPGEHTNLTEAQALASVQELCGVDDNKRCFRSFVIGMAEQSIRYAAEQFLECAERRTDADSIRWSCLPRFHYSMIHYMSLTKTAWFTCSQNAAGGYCLPHVAKVANNTCVTLVAGRSESTCSATCDTLFTGFVDGAACCVSKIHKYFDHRGEESYDRQLTPSVRYTDVNRNEVTAHITVNASQHKFDPTNLSAHVLTGALVCTTLNTTAYRAKIVETCPARNGSKCTRELRLHGLLWSKLALRPALQFRLSHALAVDIAIALGTLPEYVDGAVLEDTTQSLVDRATRTASTGTRYKFSLDGDSDADAAWNCREYDRLVSSRTLTVPSAASAIEEECATCTEGGSAGVTGGTSGPTAAGQTTSAAPSPENLFAGLVGGDASVRAAATSAAVSAVVVVLVALVTLF
jgi:hypothetical protein